MSRTECAVMRGELSAYLDGELEEKECNGLLAHLRTCAECTVFLNTLTKTITLYDQLPKPALSDESQARLKRAVIIE